MNDPWIGDWSAFLGVLVKAPVAYVALIVFLRISGKRSLAQLNLFDWVVTVALGSTVATMVLSPSVSLAEGTLALAVLLALQWAVAWTQTRSRAFGRLIRSEPTLLAHDGRLLHDRMRAERVNEQDVLQALRQSGHARLEEVRAVVLETNGSLSVLTDAGSALEPVDVPEDRGRADA
ncbi:MAG TPA: YetF domain-containing protein [Gaiellaceae bacterium]|nr:YetF domain-containing protein [Gaiellaceae bacterium]